MGTNYYGRIIPTKKRKDELKEIIDSNDFNLIQSEINKTYGRLEYDWESKKLIGGVVHLGKASAGWKFLWNPNIYLKRNGHTEKIEIEPNHYKYNYIEEPDSAIYLYPLTKKGIKAFIDREDVEIYDECEELQDKEEFFNYAINHITTINRTTGEEVEAWDSESYEKWEKKQNNNYTIYPCIGDYIDLLKSEGFKMISKSNSDFYSDGLRFATTTEFS